MVTVVDSTAPTAVAQNVTVYLDGSGSASIVAGDVNNGSSDNCSAVTLAIDSSSFNCSHIGTNNVILTVTDGSSNTSTATAVVTVVDSTTPAASAQNINVYLDATGNASITAADVDNGSIDNCTAVTLSIDSSNFDCSDVGMANNVTLTLTVSDGSNNTDTATAIVTVLDTIKPTVVTQAVTVYLDAAGNASITTTDVDNGTSDNCGAPTLSLSNTSFTCADVGANTVQLIATDVNGNIDSTSATITVNDTIKPTVVTQAVTVYLDAAGAASITTTDVDNGTSDNCGTPTLSLSNTSFTCADVGANTVQLIATDANGNIDSTSATITVNDTIKPTVVTQAVTVYLDAAGAASITTTDVDNGTSDNCGTPTLSLSNTSFTCADVGANTVQLIATDVNGNIDSTSAIITVNDTIKPTVVTQAVTVYLDAAGAASITTTDVDNGTSDNCGTPTLSLSNTSFTCADVGANTVQLIATDVNGNIDSTSATITVNDTIKPTVVAQAVTVYLDAAGNASITTIDVDNGTSDNCGTPTLSLSNTSFTCADVGANTVQLIATDVNGNIDSTSATITVNDTIKPTVVAQAVTVYLDAAGNASITTTDVDNGTSDNCGTPTLALSNTSFTCADVGANTVQLIATDVNGNIDSTSATITVTDTIKPTVVTQAVTVYLDAAGAASITTTDVDNGTSDNCGTPTLALSNTSFTCADVGANTVQLIATDANGNIDSTSATITVNDTIKPTISCLADTVICDPVFTFTIPAGNDNCAVLSVVQTAGIASGGTYPVGVTTNTFVVTDENGNVDSCSFTVTRDDFPTVANAGIDVNICVDTFNLSANTATVGVGSWSTTTTGITFDDSADPATTIRGLTRGDNVLIWTISNGVCDPSRDTITVTFDDEPTVAIAGADQVLCEVYEVTLGGNNPSIGIGTWTVSSGSGTIMSPNGANSFVSGLSDGLNQFIWTISNGTCNDSFDTVNIVVGKNPVVDVGPDRTIFQDDGTTLTAIITPDTLNGQNLTYQWQPSFYLDDATVSSTSTNSSFIEDTEFTIQVTTEQGCIGRDSINITVRTLLEIPTSFTPNGDGINDVWEIKNFEQFAKMQVVVYDPLGSEVYSSSNYDYWDGKRNGSDLPVTSYHYVITVTDFNGNTEALSGIVTILR